MKSNAVSLVRVSQLISELRQAIDIDDLDQSIISTFRSILPTFGIIGFGRIDANNCITALSPFALNHEDVNEYIHSNINKNIWNKKINSRNSEVLINKNALEAKLPGGKLLPCDAAHINKFINNNAKMRNIIILNSRFGDIEYEYTEEQIVTLSSIIDEAIRQRCSIFHGFPPNLSQRYLSEAHKRNKHVKYQAKRFFPPWLRKSPSGSVEAVETVTLTLDLRKSTFLMEKTVDPKRFADWLAAMVRVLRTIVHRHQGVFDKFTGDGIIAHFPVEDLRKIGCDNACAAAVCCADEMISAIDRLLLGLQPIIRFDSDVFSAGVGIANNRAQWQVDHGRQLIIVGTGVVDACRMSSEAPPRKILMGVNAYHAFKKSGGCPGMRQTLESFTAKGYPDENKLKVWHLERATPFAPHREQWLRDTCDNALEAIDAKVDAQPPQVEAPLPTQCCSNSTCHDGQCKTE